MYIILKYGKALYLNVKYDIPQCYNIHPFVSGRWTCIIYNMLIYINMY